MDAVFEFLDNITWWLWLAIGLTILGMRAVFFQHGQTISRNFPIACHLRYCLESIGPEKRQYFVPHTSEELIEITHASGYGHPRHFVMDNIEMNV